MKNKLALLGFLGFLGFLSSRLYAPIFNVFFLFFIFFAYWNVIPDELFKENARHAALRTVATGFTLSSAGLIIAYILTARIRLLVPLQISQSEYAYRVSFTVALVFVIMFTASICVFCFSMLWFRRKDRKLIARQEELDAENQTPGIPGKA